MLRNRVDDTAWSARSTARSPASRARCFSAASSSAPCSGPSPTTTSSNASIHSRISWEKSLAAGLLTFVAIDSCFLPALTRSPASPRRRPLACHPRPAARQNFARSDSPRTPRRSPAATPAPAILSPSATAPDGRPDLRSLASFRPFPVTAVGTPTMCVGPLPSRARTIDSCATRYIAMTSCVSTGIVGYCSRRPAFRVTSAAARLSRVRVRSSTNSTGSLAPPPSPALPASVPLRTRREKITSPFPLPFMPILHGRLAGLDHTLSCIVPPG